MPLNMPGKQRDLYSNKQGSVHHAVAPEQFAVQPFPIFCAAKKRVWEVCSPAGWGWPRCRRSWRCHAGRRRGSECGTCRNWRTAGWEVGRMPEQCISSTQDVAKVSWQIEWENEKSVLLATPCSFQGEQSTVRGNTALHACVVPPVWPRATNLLPSAEPRD